MQGPTRKKHCFFYNNKIVANLSMLQKSNWKFQLDTMPGKHVKEDGWKTNYQTGLAVNFQ